MRDVDAQTGFSLALHGLRGVAVLFVLVSHIGSGLLPFTHHGIGKVGVWIFFALSAFLLTRSMVEAMAPGRAPWHELGAYFLRRVCRIFPLFLVVLALHWGLGLMTVAEVGWHVLLQAGHGELWAIPVEFAYYFVIPCLAVLSHQTSPSLLGLLAIVALAVCVGVGVGSPEVVFSNALDLWPRLAPFVLGSLLALHTHAPAWRLPRSGIQWALAWMWVLAILLHTVAYRGISSGRFAIHWAPWLSLSLGCVATTGIALALQEGPLSRALSSRSLVYVGRISFSLYLTHMFVVDLFISAGYGGGVLRAWLVLTVCTIVAAMSWHAIERPGIALGQRLSLRLLRIRAET